MKVLVANRGEIALRVFRACRELGIATVAVVAPDDKGSLHARSADETVEIASYLFSEEHIRAAKQTGAEAIHPGYGFLAENPDFAEAVNAAELVWGGPPPEALRAGGDKLEAKRIAQEAGVPVVPTGEPDEIGYPLVVKAAAGGGGRGMRVVRSADELDEALEAARREAKAAFGDERVFCERYVERPRHVEIQLLGARALGERDCSIQRRNQKVLEEAPSPAVDEQLRTALSVVTGVDLVQAQLRIAAGESPDVRSDPRGHAVEVRLYAEDPRTFFPQTGRIERLRLPDSIRVDAGVEEGDEIGIGYDPMIAKLIAHGTTRENAFDRLAAALAETEVEGVTTNLPFLRWLVAHPLVRAGETTTAFLVEQPPLSQPPLHAPAKPWRTPFRLNLPSPAPAPPPDVAAASSDHRGARREQSRVVAPMPGTVIRLLVGEGDSVRARQPLVVLEAMKMETPLTSPYDATVRAVHVAEGDRVAGGAVLVELEE